MAAAAVIAIRNKRHENHINSKTEETNDLFEKLPPVETRELDIEIGMLMIG
jgi:hypothetical protein